MTVEQRLEQLGITLPTLTPPQFSFVPAVRTGNLLFISGQVSSQKGKLGVDVTVEQGYHASREVAIKMLAVVKDAVGDLDRVTRVVKLLGMVNSGLEFVEQPKVINGASDLLVEVFGERGKHARSAVGFAQLPFNCSVEIEGIFEVQGG
ncbi:MAG: RidA family protein [Meiothermus sp.]|nr:RidA family protein [Meiothermus sp.]